MRRGPDILCPVICAQESCLGPVGTRGQVTEGLLRRLPLAQEAPVRVACPCAVTSSSGLNLLLYTIRITALPISERHGDSSGGHSGPGSILGGPWHGEASLQVGCCSLFFIFVLCEVGPHLVFLHVMDAFPSTVV